MARPTCSGRRRKARSAPAAAPTVHSCASLAKQPAPDTAVDAYLAREMKFDPDVWIVEVEDTTGRNFLDLVSG